MVDNLTRYHHGINIYHPEHKQYLLHSKQFFQTLVSDLGQNFSLVCVQHGIYSMIMTISCEMVSGKTTKSLKAIYKNEKNMIEFLHLQRFHTTFRERKTISKSKELRTFI